MELKTNHKDQEIDYMIMSWLFKEYSIEPADGGLDGELLFALLPESEFIRLEIYLSDFFDYNIDLPRDLRFITK